MKRARLGFTLIEISFFLALTGVLFISIAIGTSNTLWQQKYNDSVQSFSNFIRSIYAQVSNTQRATGEGRSDRAIYGKLITFGEEYDLKGVRISSDEQRIFVYDVIGNAGSVGTGDIKDLFTALNVNIVDIGYSGGSITDVTPSGFADSYMPTWGAVIDSTEHELFTGSILVVRHPRSGVINTLYSPQIVPVNETVKFNFGGAETLLSSRLDSFTADDDIDFCLNPYGMGQSGSFIRDIRISKNARNSSGVVIIDQDGSDNRCK